MTFAFAASLDRRTRHHSCFGRACRVCKPVCQSASLPAQPNLCTDFYWLPDLSNSLNSNSKHFYRNYQILINKILVLKLKSLHFKIHHFYKVNLYCTLACLRNGNQAKSIKPGVVYLLLSNIGSTDS